MTDFVRIPGKIFAENASPVGNDPQIGKFGNAKQGIYTGEADVQEIQNSDAWSQGWTSAVVSAMNFPPLPEMNGVLKVLSYQICYLLQKGIPEWNADTIYYTNDYVNYNGKLYYSSIDNNTFEPETRGAGNNWLSGTSDVAIATNETNGISRPDNKTLTINEDGILSVNNSENDTIPLFTGQYFDFKPNHICWAKADTELSGKIYESAYNELVNIENGSITKYGEGFKVIKESDKLPDVDYSLYWIIDTNSQTFKTPSKISYIPYNPNVKSIPVVGNGNILGLTAGSDPSRGNNRNFTLVGISYGGNLYGVAPYVFNQPVSAGESTGGGYGLYPYTFGISTDPEISGLVADLSAIISKEALLYFKVGNAVENQQIINCGEVLEELNLAIKKNECKAYVIETYESGTSGYRVWSDGYCEQWTSKDWGDTGSFTFLKPYNNANWILVFNSLKSDTNSNLGIVSKSNTGFEYNNALTTLSGDMYVVGYLKEGTY